MENVKLFLDEEGNGRFYIMDGEDRAGEMQINISGKALTVYHTEVLPKAEGKGLAKELLNAMVDYARKNGLQVIALCPYVHLQFTRHPERYADIWDKAQ
ncbi:MAG TPA: GNAT family N-acetyltransferase [Agriterribacter sp.]|nr:GNAT family N-acetyltransferase [Agriterribacter sp.]